MQHQYIDRETGTVKTEIFQGDAFINFLYSTLREKSDFLFKMFTDAKFTHFLSYLNYDLPISEKKLHKYIEIMNICKDEMLEDIKNIKTLRALFERKIKYWLVRPMTSDEKAVVSPCDAKCHVGTFRQNSMFFIKEKFFDTYELFGKIKWFETFIEGDYAIFRLTPEKYHYNHCPVSGIVEDFYEIEGYYHSCNPHALMSIENPLSKNKRYVTIINTDVDNGTKIGYVAMIEIVAMMIGKIEQCYSDEYYDSPQSLYRGLFIKRGQPKSLFKPGSSTTVIFFQKNKIEFCQDLIVNQKRRDVKSRISFDLLDKIVETDLKVRSTIGYKK